MSGHVRSVVLAALVLSTAGCTVTVAGRAGKAENSVPVIAVAEGDADLDRVLLTADEADEILGVRGLEPMDTRDVTDSMNVNPNPLSEERCRSAVFGAQEAVYAGTGWTAVRDQVLSTSGSRQSVEQTVVRYPSTESARSFFESSRQMWSDCAGLTVGVGTGRLTGHWEIGDVVEEGSLFTQPSYEQQNPEWPCDHALAVAANLIFETTSCGVGIDNDAAALALRMVDKAAAL